MSDAAGQLTDTIVAPCTAPGAGERAIVRVSGRMAHELTAQVLGGVPATESEDGQPGQPVVRALFDLGAVRGDAPVPVQLLRWWAPRSLTGEHVVEIHMPAWPALVTEFVRRLVGAGARPAARGEFARRAWVHGKLDAAGVMALSQLVNATTIAEAAEAAEALVGQSSIARRELAAALLDALALIEAHVDFEEEDTEEVGEADLRAALERVADCAQAMGQRGSGAAVRDGVTDVVLLGVPNVGKSSLFGALCPGARSAVSAVAGTTRDALEAHVTRAGRRFRILDGPGLDEQFLLPSGLQDPGSEAADHQSLDVLAMQRYVAQLPPDAVVLFVDGPADGQPQAGTFADRLCQQLVADRPCVRVWNKIDLLPEQQRMGARSGGCLPVSALQGWGLEELWEAVLKVAPVALSGDLSLRADADAAQALLPWLEELDAAPLEGALPALSLALRDMLEVLERDADARLDVDEEILDRVFSGFCVGK